MRPLPAFAWPIDEPLKPFPGNLLMDKVDFATTSVGTSKLEVLLVVCAPHVRRSLPAPA